MLGFGVRVRPRVRVRARVRVLFAYVWVILSVCKIVLYADLEPEPGIEEVISLEVTKRIPEDL